MKTHIGRLLYSVLDRGELNDAQLSTDEEHYPLVWKNILNTNNNSHFWVRIHVVKGNPDAVCRQAHADERTFFLWLDFNLKTHFSTLHRSKWNCIFCILFGYPRSFMYLWETQSIWGMNVWFSEIFTQIQKASKCAQQSGMCVWDYHHPNTKWWQILFLAEKRR